MHPTGSIGSMGGDFGSAIETAKFRIGDDFLDAALLTTITFLKREPRTLLGRLYNHWTDCGKVSNDGFSVPHRDRFDISAVTNRHERRFVFSIEVEDDDFSRSMEAEASIFGHQNPFHTFTHSSIFHCVARREPMYFLLQMEIGQLSQSIYRLMLPSVGSGSDISRIDIVHRFAGPPLRLVGGDPFTWTPE